MTGKVVHCKKEAYDIYIGRPSKWGNPYTHLMDTKNKALFVYPSREAAIEAYRKRLIEHIKTEQVSLEELASLHNKILGCWCAPKACHGDVLIKASAWAYKQLNPEG